MFPSLLLVATSVFAAPQERCTATTAKALCEISKKPPLDCIKCAPNVVECDTLKCDVSTNCNNVVVPPTCARFGCTDLNARALCNIAFAKKPPLNCIKCAPNVVECDTLKCDVSTNCNIKVVPPTCERPKECNATTAKALCEIAKKPLLRPFPEGCIKCAPGVVQCNSIKCDVSTNCNNVVVPPPPCKCSAVFAPVCGDDGVTYSNECELNAKNVKKQFDGKCKCKCTGVTPLGCPVPKICPKGFEYGGCRQLCNQATCKWELLAPGCVRIISPPEPRK